MEKRPTQDLAAVEDILHDGQLAHVDRIATDAVRAHDSYGRESLGETHHSLEAVRKQQIVGLQNLTILCFICDNSKPSLVVFVAVHEFVKLK